MQNELIGTYFYAFLLVCFWCLFQIMYVSVSRQKIAGSCDVSDEIDTVAYKLQCCRRFEFKTEFIVDELIDFLFPLF